MAEEPGPPAAPRKVRVAVLPMVHVGPESGDEYFADGMTEELIATLSRISDLRVIARTSAMRYKGSGKGIAEIGRELNARTIIEGSVRVAGRRLRIAVQAVDAATEEPLWSQTYDRELADIFEIQREIAQRVARALRVRIRAAEASALGRPVTEDVDAYALYLRGRFHWNQRTATSLQEAIGLYERALAKDPKFALAHAGIADAQAALALLEVVPPSDAFPKARVAAERAIAIDPRLAEAHASLGLVMFQYDRAWGAAEEAFRTALDLNPNYPPAHQFYADYLKAMGRFEEALAEMRQALELDPLSLSIATGVGHVLYLSRRYDEAIAQYRRATGLDPTFVQAHLWFGRPYLEKGMYDEAIDELRQAVELSKGSTISLAVLGHAYASAGRTDEARDILEKLLDRSKERYLPSYWIALIYTGLQETDSALRWLERAYEERSAWLVWIKVEPRFDRLRSDPRFVSLLHRMDLDTAPGGKDAGAAGPDPAIVQWIGALDEIRPGRFQVVGSYTRYDESARHSLKDLRQRIVGRLGGGKARIENFLLWAPPGSGKSFFVQEVGRSLPPGTRYQELNLAALDEPAFRSALLELGRAREPLLCFIDEVDSKPKEPWPYEALLPELEPRGERAAALVVVMAGSSGADVDGLRKAIRARPKGADLLSRIPSENAFAIPTMGREDRVLVAVSTVRGLASRQRREVDEVERLALAYLATAADLASPRQLREFVAKSLERLPAGEDRLKFDHLFDPGDARNKEFWLRARSRAPLLQGSYVAIGD